MLQRIDRYRRLSVSVAGILAMILFSPLLIQLFSQDSADASNQGRRRLSKPALESGISRENHETAKEYTIGVRVDFVLMYASVFDKNGKFVGGLQKDGFKIYEDGIEQDITSFAQEDVPISMGILLDLSGSMRKKMQQVENAALAFLRASNPQDQTFLIGFNDEVELLQDFTSDVDEIADSLENAIVSGSTALYDAIYLGVQKAHTGKKSKKAVILISDGKEKDSYYTLDELLSKVQESDVQVFCIGLLDISPNKGIFGRLRKSGSDKAAYDALMRISEETGGKAFFPGDIVEIHDIVAEIANELRSQYSIGYFSSNSVRDGSFRRVKIRLTDSNAKDYRLRYRRGYFALKSEITSN
jgi:Ca-activated chloride channel family protein